jgi:hypothetical protein
MKKGYLYLAAAAVMMMVMPLFSTGLDDLQVNKLTVDRMKHFPVPKDNINYVFLQSIEGDTSIVIGDFSGLEKKIVMIVDQKSDNTIDAVFEYFPLTKDLRKKTDSQSKFFTNDIVKLKKDIIEGAVYKGNYTDNMKSLGLLESILNNPSANSLYSNVYGFNVKFLETDETHKHSALFSYGKNAGGYYLQFKTEYYRKDFNTVQNPVLKFSVYCRNSNDPVVKETVENLFKVKQPDVNTAMAGK